MALYYDLDNTGPEVQERLNQVPENAQDIFEEEANRRSADEDLSVRLNELSSIVGPGGSVDARIAAGVAIEAENRLIADESLQEQINTLNEAVGEGGSVDERINIAKEEVVGGAGFNYNTLGKLQGKLLEEEERASISEENLRRLYENLVQSGVSPMTEEEWETLSSDPSDLSEQVIYRVAGTTSYTDYMYNGVDIIPMATYDNAIDDEPTPGSDNLVKSGGITTIYGAYHESSEWLRLITDGHGHILCGIKKNGAIEWSLGVPMPVTAYVQSRVNEIMQGTGGAAIDGLNDVISFLAGFATSDTLPDILAGKVDAVEGLSLIDADYAAGVIYEEDDEFIAYTEDATHVFIEGVKKDGTKVLGGDLDIHLVNVGRMASSEYFALLIDGAKKIIAGIKKDGDIVFGVGIPSDIRAAIEDLSARIAANTEAIANMRGRVTTLKISKNGNNYNIRTRLSSSNDIIIRMNEHPTGKGMTYNAVYVGSRTLTDGELITSEHRIANTSDMVGAIGIATMWFLYAQHGWTIPLFNANANPLTNADVGAVWADAGGHRFKVGKVDGNYIYLLPELTEDPNTGVFSASWQGTDSYPTSLTHVSGGVYEQPLTGTSSRYDLVIQTVTKRKVTADGMELTEDGVYYCEEFVISEHILGHNVGKVQTWFPSPVYNGSLIDWERTFVFNGSTSVCNTILNAQYPFEITDYRGIIPMLPLQFGDYHSFSMLPKVKKQVNGHRVDIPFNSDGGTVGDDYVSVTRNTSDLYDVNDQPDRCICLLKDNGDNYLVGMAGGCSLTRGISVKEFRNGQVPIGVNTATYGGASTPNKFYPKCLRSQGFPNAIVTDSFINELSGYFAWFDPAENDGQVYWYKDGSDYIVYIHNQSAHAKLPVNLPSFMEEMNVVETIELTAGATLLTSQVVAGRIYVNFDTATNNANYIVLKIR